MAKPFIDSDVIVDVLIKRDEYESSAKLFTLIDKDELGGCTSPIKRIIKVQVICLFSID
jgi:hypothetical protein